MIQQVRQSALLRRAALLLAVLHVGWQLGVCLPILWRRTDTERDLVIYHAAARNAQAGTPLYTPWPEYGPDRTPFRYFYPPPFAVILAPLGRLSLIAFARLWYALLFLAFWVYAGCLTHLVCGRLTLAGWLLAGLLLDWFPRVDYALAIGQAEPMLWALFGLAFCTRATGMLLAIAAQIKLYAFWPLLALAWRGERKTARQAGFTLAVGTLLGIVGCGAQSYVLWTQAALPVVGQGTFNPDNVSLSFLGLRWARMAGWSYAAGPLPNGAKFYLMAMEVAGPLLAAWMTRKKETGMQAACVAVAGALFAPICWTCYLPLLLIPVALGLRAWTRAALTTQTRDHECPTLLQNPC